MSGPHTDAVGEPVEDGTNEPIEGGPVFGPTAMVVGAWPLDAGFWFEAHTHPQPQVLWSPRGAIGVTVDTGNRTEHWALPPTRALWVPTGVPHRTGATRAATLHGIFLNAERCPLTWRSPTVLAVSPLLAELIRYLRAERLGEPERARAEAVLLDLLDPLPSAPLEVRMPPDPRAAQVAALLRANPADQRGLPALARAAGTSPRTLSRLFLAGTGTSFDRWRTTMRMSAALPLLADSQPVSRVAHAVGYATPSAFLAAFCRTVGCSPRAYLAARG
jgi:AraC-like DNA-binding protein/quercetin dioxygenase-like cupin family protein